MADNTCQNCGARGYRVQWKRVESGGIVISGGIRAVIVRLIPCWPCLDWQRAEREVEGGR